MTNFFKICVNSAGCTDGCSLRWTVLFKGFIVCNDYIKPVKKADFISLSSESFFSKVGKENAKITLSRIKPEDEEIIVDYNILIKDVR